MLGIVALTYPSINLMFLKVYEDITKGKDTGAIAKMLLGNPYSFPETWHTVAFLSSVFIMIPAILVIMLVPVFVMTALWRRVRRFSLIWLNKCLRAIAERVSP